MSSQRHAPIVHHRRRQGGAALAGAVAPVKAQAAAIPIIDCHIHLFDQTRPQGAPYSGGGANKEPALPARYRKLASPPGNVGAIEVEASPWIEDNLWVLEVEQGDQMMVGTMGNLQPDKPEFKEYLDRCSGHSQPAPGSDRGYHPGQRQGARAPDHCRSPSRHDVAAGCRREDGR